MRLGAAALSTGAQSRLSCKKCGQLFICRYGGGGGVAQSVERATPGEEVPDSIPAVVARALLVGSMSV